MPPEKIATPQEKGKILCETFSALSKKSFPLLNIYPQPGSPPIALKDEYGDTKNWNKFVQFPSELNGLIPGSYVNPSLFLETLGKTEGSNDNIKKMISTEMGTAEEPIFTFDQGNFGLRIMNGMANKHALSMSRLAQEVSDKKYTDGFASDNASGIRAEYQNAMAQNISQELMRIPKKMPAVRIHDDCLASGDSIISYLYDRVQDAGELDKLQKNGVNIVIDGAATAQGILYLQMFANSFHIPLELTAGHMAFGLTAGVRENPEAPLRHANYITYPPQSDKEFYKKLGKIERHQIEGFGDAGAVAGDMGEAERGIDNATMQAIRQWVGDENYCKWNDERTDDHGGHKLSKKGISIQTKSGEGVTDHVYFARGGFLPYMFDLMTILSKQSPVAEKANVIITRLSRLNVTDGEYGKLGYGAGFTEASCVKYVS